MKKTRLIFYWAILVLLMFLYYVVSEAFYLVSSGDINERKLVAQLIAFYNLPMILALGFMRLWLLKPVSERQRFLDIFYFVVPVLIIIACFATWIWVGIILSVLAGGIIVREFIVSVIKRDSVFLRKR